MIYPPLTSSYVLPETQVIDEEGHTYTLNDLIHKSEDPGITLLIPGFMQCHGVCPALAHLYKGLLSDPLLQKGSFAKSSVIFFSFDPRDDSETLKMFREHSDLPTNWKVVRASPEHTERLLKSLQYTVMKTEDGMYQHPAQAFVFTKDLNWIGSLYGTDISTSEITKIFNNAVMQQTHPQVYSLIQQIQNPNTLAIVSGTGLLVSIALVLYLAIQISKKRASHRV